MSTVAIQTWEDLKAVAFDKCKSPEYLARLKFEITEIEKQGAADYWLDLFQSNQKFYKGIEI